MRLPLQRTQPEGLGVTGRKRLSDLIIDGGPTTQKLVITQGFSRDMWILEADRLNELRDDLIAGREARERLDAMQGGAPTGPEPEWHRGCTWCWRTAWHAAADQKGPSGPLSATESAQDGSAGVTGAPEAHSGSEAVPFRDGVHERLHPTCHDISARSEPPGTAYVCVSECRGGGA